MYNEGIHKQTIDKKMNEMNKQQLIDVIGEEKFQQLIDSQLDFSNIITDGTAYNGFTAFFATVGFTDVDGDDVTARMDVFVDTDVVNDAPSLCYIDWDEALKDAEFSVY